jgi:monoamine oxidase
MKKENVIFVGGGAAGLMAAKELADECNVILLEAASRIGGRIWSRPSQHSSQVIEAGAEFIHGHQKQTIGLLKEAGINYVPVEGNMYRREKGAWIEQTEIIEGWGELLEKMRKVKTDMTMHDFLRQYFGGDEYAELRKHAISYAEGFDLADTKKASVQSLYREWSNEEEQSFRIPAGYGALLNFLKDQCGKKGCRILINHTVKQIDWGKNKVMAYTSDEQKFPGNKLIIAVPLSVLTTTGNKYSINFTPSLDQYIKAANDIGMGAVIKVVVQFHERFWKEDIGFVFSDEAFPTWWTQLPDKSPVFSGWLGGPGAEQLNGLNDKQILQMAIMSLSSIFDRSYSELENNLKQADVFNWQGEELNLHGYSYGTLKTNEASQLLNTPVADTIFFAGEALYKGNSPGTVEAALVSGKEAAAKLIQAR